MNLAEAVRSTTFRWSLAIVAALLLQSAILAGAFYLLTARHAIAEVDRTLSEDCSATKDLSRDAIVASIRARVAGDVHRVDLEGLFDPAGVPIAGNVASIPPALVRSDGPLVVGLVRTKPPDPQPNASRSIACTTAGGDRLVFARDTDELDYISALSRGALLGATLPIVLLAAALGLLLGQRAQLRLNRVKATVEEIMAGDLRKRLPVRSSADPFDRLSSAVNLMLDRLEVAVGDIRCLGDDIAHELRTPLTRLRARLERGCLDAAGQAEFREVGERAIRDIDHALSIVSALLRIRGIEEAKRGSEFKPMDLKSLLEDAAGLYQPVADEKEVALTLDAPAAAIVTADRDLLMEAVCNLIDNAIKFTPRGGHVRCHLSADPPVLSVTDDGTGIAAGERAAVLRRFHRGSSHGTIHGHGIGLSLVAAIVRLHGFQLSIGDAAPGCRVEIACGALTTPPRPLPAAAVFSGAKVRARRETHRAP